MTYRTIALNNEWDIYLNEEGSLAINTDAAAIAQDVATACLTVKGEQIFYPRLGIPLFNEVLGKSLGTTLATHLINEEAKTIKQVTESKTILIENNKGSRKYNGFIVIQSTVGEVQLTL